MREDYKIPENDKKTGPQIQRLRELSTDELLDAFADLLNDMTEDNYSAEALDLYLSALEERGAVPRAFDTENSLTEFEEKHKRLFAENEISAESTTSPKRRHLARRIVIIAAAVMLGVVLVAQAAGVDIFGIFARWDDETFRFTTNVNDYGADVDGEYASLEDALNTLRVDTPVAPTWYPEGFAHEATTVTSWEDRSTINSIYKHNEDSYIVTIILYNSLKNVDTKIFEKDKTELYVYEVGGNAHYIMENLGQARAAWITGNMMCSISGDLDRADIVKMIDSIYGG